jgi:YHS domain-containing protein
MMETATGRHILNPRVPRGRALSTLVLILAAGSQSVAQQANTRNASVRAPEASAAVAAAQAEPQHQHPPPTQKPGAPPQQPAKPGVRAQEPAKAEMTMTGPLGISMARNGSGTSWLPGLTPMHAIHRQAGAWGLMGHGNLFLQYIDESGPRGDNQFGSINWFMGMAQRTVGGGPLMFRAMLSLEPATVRACGYPDLLATGEFCNDQPLHDRQHPHDLFMELAAQYQREINPRLAYQLYGAIAGEPALGPTAYPHRLSAMLNPLAPVAHHWLDSTHIAFGVVSAGIFQRRWKVEGSVFNGREPDQDRYDWDLDKLDSVAGRVWVLPTDRWSLQFSAGHLNEAEQHEIGGPRQDADRVTASATYHRPQGEQRFWASTVAWGRNHEEDIRTNAFLAETSLELDQRNTVFGRGEIVEKTGADLVLPEEREEDVFTVGKLQGGYLRQFGPIAAMVPSIGAGLSVSFVPDRLRPFYENRASVGFSVFFNLRPVAMSHQTDHEKHAPSAQPGAVAPTPPTGHEHPPPKPGPPPAASAPPRERKPETRPTPSPAAEPTLPVLPAERVIDPACEKTIDLAKAPRATYQGKVYYFCVERDRDEFLKEPAAYLKKRGWS